MRVLFLFVTLLFSVTTAFASGKCEPVELREAIGKLNEMHAICDTLPTRWRLGPENCFIGAQYVFSEIVNCKGNPLQETIKFCRQQTYSTDCIQGATAYYSLLKNWN